MTEREQDVQPLYEVSVNVRVAWQAQSLSNAGNNGSNRLLPRRQLLADGTETDAHSGNIAKHYHATLLAEYLEAAGSPLCPACQARDGRRAAALIDGRSSGISLSSRSCAPAACAIRTGFSSRRKTPPAMGAARPEAASPSTPWSSSPSRWRCPGGIKKRCSCSRAPGIRRKRDKC